jgi:hypothetical protein
MPWAGPRWRTVTAQLSTGSRMFAGRRRCARGATRMADGHAPRRGNRTLRAPPCSPSMPWHLACCAGRRQCMGRGGARVERVRPCATHVHRSKLLFEMELDFRGPLKDETRYGIPVHESMPCADHGLIMARCTVASCHAPLRHALMYSKYKCLYFEYRCLYSKWVALSRAVYSSGTRDGAAAFSVTTCEDTHSGALPLPF